MTSISGWKCSAEETYDSGSIGMVYVVLKHSTVLLIGGTECQFIR